MSSGKQPLEGLTVRIWDPPSTSASKDKSSEEKLLKGSRGFREYTEQIGSDKLKYKTHDWDTESNKARSDQGLTKSTRNWDAEKKKLETLDNMPLVSRSDAQVDGKSLRDSSLQFKLWKDITDKMNLLSLDAGKDQWDPIVVLFRKLREGVYASNWSHGDYEFAILVFQESANCSIRAQNYQELVKSLGGLRDLYDLNKNSANPYYIVIDILYHSCYIRNSKIVMDCVTRLDQGTNEGIFGRRLVKCLLVSENPIRYFQLYYNNPYPTFRTLMDNYNDTMRIKAIDMLRKSYLSASIEWVGIWLGIKNNNQLVLTEIDRLVQPTCIKSVDADRQIVHFLKKKKVTYSHTTNTYDIR